MSVVVHQHTLAHTAQPAHQHNLILGCCRFQRLLGESESKPTASPPTKRQLDEAPPALSFTSVGGKRTLSSQRRLDEAPAFSITNAVGSKPKRTLSSELQDSSPESPAGCRPRDAAPPLARPLPPASLAKARMQTDLLRRVNAAAALAPFGAGVGLPPFALSRGLLDGRGLLPTRPAAQSPCDSPAALQRPSPPPPSSSPPPLSLPAAAPTASCDAGQPTIRPAGLQDGVARQHALLMLASAATVVSRCPPPPVAPRRPSPPLDIQQIFGLRSMSEPFPALSEPFLPAQQPAAATL